MYALRASPAISAFLSSMKMLWSQRSIHPTTDTNRSSFAFRQVGCIVVTVESPSVVVIIVINAIDDNVSTRSCAQVHFRLPGQ